MNVGDRVNVRDKLDGRLVIADALLTKGHNGAQIVFVKIEGPWGRLYAVPRNCVEPARPPKRRSFF